ncbi:MAG: glycoside hydrolase family 127 protein, partial [Clostridia bacterium]|nr:glycoside hydrolase family 127 protein [Clostridia bacterium]
SGWDMWCRKYVLTGMLHFCDVCNDVALVNCILDAMERHLDCIIRAVGSATGQIEITSTSDYWLGVNSCSILEPVMDLYKRRPQKRFLSFAEYIIGTGGCSGGDLISLALQNEKAPYQYPETKAYETMSFFEGVLAYAEVTDSEKYFNAVVRFAEKVYETDITLIGCAGCTHELFDNSAVRQTEYSDLIMQETCVTVTWMRLCARLYLLTGDSKYADRIECSALNALFGSVNIYKQPFTIVSSGYKLPWLPFDSYSPLFMNRRGREVGGCKFFDDGSFYGCCVAIGIAGLAVYSLIDSLKKPEESLYVLNEHRLNGKIAFTYGPYVLARDKAKEKKDINVSVRPRYDNGVLRCKHLPCMPGESIRILLETEDGNVLLTNYASCGKRWAEEEGIISVWLPT